MADSLRKIKFLPFSTVCFYLKQVKNKISFRSDHARKRNADRMALECYRNAVVNKLHKKFRKTIAGAKSEIDGAYASLSHDGSDNVWIYWGQGVENAPDIVRLCVRSVMDNFTNDGRRVILLNDDNISDYVTFPDYIMEKYRKGIITRALFSDLLRLELLITHGGTWVDSTVFCSHGGGVNSLIYV